MAAFTLLLVFDLFGLGLQRLGCPLAVPLYDQARRIGCGLMWLLGGSRTTVLSMFARGCTTPIAMDVSTALGGDPGLTALFTASSGLLGAVLGPPLLRAIKVRRDLPAGVALGTASHGIGTARALRDGEAVGAAVAMTIAGVLTAVTGIVVRRIAHG